jgi:hypothetical protein
MRFKGLLAGLLILAMTGVGWGQISQQSPSIYSIRQSDGSAPSDGQAIAYQASSKKWISQTLVGIGAGVTLQGSSPGTPDTGNLNISGTAVAGAFSGPLTGNLTGSQILTPTPANLGYSGVSFTATAGENVAIGDVCYMKSDGKYWLAKADVATTKMPGVVIATGTISANATGVSY